MIRTNRVISRAGLGLLFGLALLGSQGCYSRVIDAHGIGADETYPERHESSQPPLDRWIDQQRKN